ncbi:glycoside hydrolase family protein [Sphingomonas sp.]|uniref:glycoside hydrolase family protein n=1 Tax=Sphingomonas sp. TaxID=28214 RepID=UPI0025FD1F69|nr:glycoside hydrolase family protein [Sphingomonas sp.]
MGGYSRPKLEAEVIRDEDERLRVYRCTSNKQTIGIGRNLDDVGISAAETKALGITTASCIAKGITREQSRALFANDIGRVEADLDRALPWWRTLSDARQRVMLNMTFNMGIGRRAAPGKPAKGMLSFEGGTLRAVREGRWADAAKGMLASKWAGQVGARANRLAAMMLAG